MTVDGREIVGFASNDYLGLAAHETLGGELLWVLASCVVLVGVFFPLATWAYRRKI